ncbi:hypothetical protein MJH12_05095, partial [bacterium]|nr:hypothetical protein [bacterium]
MRDISKNLEQCIASHTYKINSETDIHQQLSNLFSVIFEMESIKVSEEEIRALLLDQPFQFKRESIHFIQVLNLMLDIQT